MHEAQMHEHNSFITLTYSNSNIPADSSVDVVHWQKFARRLRKIRPFRFFHCGEYGEKLGRPHYHACMFGIDFRDDRKAYKETHNGDMLYTSPLLDEVWGKGLAVIGDLSFKSAAYVARYVMKKQNGQNAIKAYGGLVEWTDTQTGEVSPPITRRAPPYVTMSRKPGLGHSWFQKYYKDIYPRDECIINGKKCRPPAYYDTLYGEIFPEKLVLVKFKRRLQGAKHEENNTRDRLDIREEILERKLNQLHRDIE